MRGPLRARACVCMFVCARVCVFVCARVCLYVGVRDCLSVSGFVEQGPESVVLSLQLIVLVLKISDLLLKDGHLLPNGKLEVTLHQVLEDM